VTVTLLVAYMCRGVGKAEPVIEVVLYAGMRRFSPAAGRQEKLVSQKAVKTNNKTAIGEARRPGKNKTAKVSLLSCQLSPLDMPALGSSCISN